VVDSLQDLRLALANRGKLLSKRGDAGWEFGSAAPVLQRSLSSGKPFCPDTEKYRE
jgi:hypothetical protein